jgi:phosphoglycerate dehydrogenase-like enzyme
MASFRIAVERTLRRENGTSSYPLDALDGAGLSWSFIEQTSSELRPEQIDGFDAVIFGGSDVSAASVQCDHPPLVLARLGAGYETVAIDACTERGIMVTTAPDGVRLAMASSAIAFMLALAHRLVEKDRRTRAGIWDRSAIGVGIGGRTLGVLGLGNIGREVCALAASLPVRRIGHDNFAAPVEGVVAVDLNTLMRQSDFLIVTLPLTDDTHHLVDADHIALMKPGAYLINIARGPVVDQAALTVAISEGRLAGAALDVFEQEPLPTDDPLLALDNVILTGHDMGLTLDMTNDVARSVCQSVIEVAQGRVPTRLINPAVLVHPRLGALRREAAHA